MFFILGFFIGLLTGIIYMIIINQVRGDTNDNTKM